MVFFSLECVCCGLDRLDNNNNNIICTCGLDVLGGPSDWENLEKAFFGFVKNYRSSSLRIQPPMHPYVSSDNGTINYPMGYGLLSII